MPEGDSFEALALGIVSIARDFIHLTLSRGDLNRKIKGLPEPFEELVERHRKSLVGMESLVEAIQDELEEMEKFLKTIQRSADIIIETEPAEYAFIDRAGTVAQKIEVRTIPILMASSSHMLCELLEWIVRYPDTFEKVLRERLRPAQVEALEKILMEATKKGD